MSTTNLATGWSREFPTVEGAFYWVRHKLISETAHTAQLRDGSLYFTDGTSMSPSPRKDCEFAGPITPADFEQLAALRTAAQLAMFYFESDPQATAHGREIAAALRNALGLQDGQNET